MSNARQAQHPIASPFTARWSPRAFDGQPLSEAQMRSLFEAARWAPSAYNFQPWRFCYALAGTPRFEEFVALLVPANQAWARHAGALVAVLSQSTRTDAEGAEQPFPSHAFDTGAAWMSLAMQAYDMGLATHAMGGFDAERARHYLQLPANVAIHAFVAIGQRATPVPSPKRCRPASRPATAIHRRAGCSRGRWPERNRRDQAARLPILRSARSPSSTSTAIASQIAP